MPSKIETLMPSIKKIFIDIRSHVSGIERNTAQKDQVIKSVCDYVIQTITAESKSLLSSFYSNLMDETLSQGPFLNNTKNKNKFYRYDILNMIFEKYSFSVAENIDYEQAHEKYSYLPIPAGTAGIGVVLSIALSNAIILPVSLIFAGCLYYFISEKGKEKNRAEFKSAINHYLVSVESELCIWFKNIEDFYNKQVSELITTLESDNNEK